MINQDYQKFSCIKNLGEYKDIFHELVNFYGEDLNDKIVIDGSVYTLHDFNNHCTDIYKIISEVLLDSKRAYSDGLSSKELYLLDLAVLFHDISMSCDIMVERTNHSQKSAQKVQDIYDDTESPLYKKAQLNQNDIKILKAIILAHSDVKDGSVPVEKRGLNDPTLRDDMPTRIGSVRAKLLAGILRLADELDITSDRLGNTNIEKNLKSVREKFLDMDMQVRSKEQEVNQDKYEKYKKYVESLSHWEFLHLFSQVTRESQDDIVYLVTDDQHIQNLLDSGSTSAELARKILKVYDKVIKEWREIKHKTIDDSHQKLDVKSFFPVTDIRVKCSVDSVRKELDRQMDNIKNVKEVSMNQNTEKDFSDNGNATENKFSNSGNQSEQCVQLISDKLSNMLKREIKRRHLLRVGHFLLDDNFCARDWIDTKEVVETKVIVVDIVECFIKHIKDTCDLQKKYLVVGLDLEGALLASRVAMGMKMPFSYIIPVRDRLNSSPKETELSVVEYDGIILIVDAIVTFDTIKKALNDIMKSNQLGMEQMQEKITHIYSIFYRKNNLVNLEEMEGLHRKTFYGNDDFPIELFKKEECRYIKEGQCLALNSRLRGNSSNEMHSNIWHNYNN